MKEINPFVAFPIEKIKLRWPTILIFICSTYILIDLALGVFRKTDASTLENLRNQGWKLRSNIYCSHPISENNFYIWNGTNSSYEFYFDLEQRTWSKVDLPDSDISAECIAIPKPSFIQEIKYEN